MSTQRRRTKPYTEIGIRRVPCSRCGKPSTQQWQICADRRTFRGVCTACDIAINDIVLTFMKHPDRKQLMKAYRRKMLPL